MDIKPFTALLIDDEEELVTTLVERMEYRGIQADFATSGSAALAKLQNKTFDVVVLDLKMPGMSGIEVMRIIRREYPQTPVLLITGHGSIGEKEGEDVPTGAFDYLPKPINIDELIERMRAAVEATRES